jgi:hypothetical protein
MDIVLIPFHLYSVIPYGASIKIGIFIAKSQCRYGPNSCRSETKKISEKQLNEVTTSQSIMNSFSEANLSFFLPFFLHYLINIQRRKYYSDCFSVYFIRLRQKSTIREKKKQKKKWDGDATSNSTMSKVGKIHGIKSHELKNKLYQITNELGIGKIWSHNRIQRWID